MLQVMLFSYSISAGITFRLPVSGKQSNQLSTSTSPKDDTKTTAQDDNR